MYNTNRGNSDNVNCVLGFANLPRLIDSFPQSDIIFTELV